MYFVPLCRTRAARCLGDDEVSWRGEGEAKRAAVRGGGRRRPHGGLRGEGVRCGAGGQRGGGRAFCIFDGQVLMN